MNKRVLVVDDSTTIQKIFKIAFSPYPVEVPVTASFLEAINEADKAAPDVVVLDTGLLVSSKSNQLPTLQTKCPEVPFVLLVGSHEKIDVDDLKGQGFSHFLKKPFEVQDILKVISEVLGVDWTDEGGQQDTVVPPPPPPAAALPLSNDITAPPHESVAPPPPPPPPPIQSGGLSLGQGVGQTPPLPNQGIASDSVPISTNQVDFTKPPVPLETDDSRKGIKAFDDSETDEAASNDGPDLNKYAFASIDDELPETRIIDENTPSTNKLVQKELSKEFQDSIQQKLESFIRDDAPVIVRKAVEDFCEKKFAALAKEVLTSELRRLAEEKSRLLSDQ